MSIISQVTDQEITISPTADGRLPMPGDAVRIINSDESDTVYRDGKIGIIQGIVGKAAAEYMVCFAYSAFRGRQHPYSLGNEYVSCSGGPVPWIQIDKLEGTDETVDARFWRWNKNGPAADCASEYVMKVPVWNWHFSR